MWKRDLSRFFLQIPLDPVEFHRVCFIWRCLYFFFIGLAFGLRHSGLQGQKLTDCVSWVHTRRGLETDAEQLFNIVNYSDDFGGVEADKERATESFAQLKWLLEDLGLQEATKKAEPPSTQMTFLGVMFDSSNMTMRVPPDKLAEIKSEIGLWAKKTTITKQNLQSLLGKHKKHKEIGASEQIPLLQLQHSEVQAKCRANNRVCLVGGGDMQFACTFNSPPRVYGERPPLGR